MIDESLVQQFDNMYDTDLVYMKDCWKLCGDAHCCSFSRYKSRFKLIAQEHYQELPLLPDEYDYLKHKGWLGQFGDFDHKTVEYAFNGSTMRVESIVSRKPGCACEHDTRPVICRLYPLFPIFDIHGHILGIDSVGIYEVLEKLDGLQPACALTQLPFGELQKFLSISAEIASNPKHVFYCMAYRITIKHVRTNLMNIVNARSKSVFSLFENAFIRKKLIDDTELKQQLSTLVNEFQTRHVMTFTIP